MANNDDIDTEMYLRDGFPHATVCKVTLQDGRIGIGLFRQVPGLPGCLESQAADAAALADALENVPDAPVPGDGSYIERQLEEDDDLQAKLGQPAHS